MSRSDDDDYDDRPRNRPRRRPALGVPCPKCGSRYSRKAPWPWYLGTVGAILCKAVVCTDCGHEFDANKPRANLERRKRNLAIGINGCGCLGMIFVLGLLALWLSYTMQR